MRHRLALAMLVLAGCRPALAPIPAAGNPSSIPRGAPFGPREVPPLTAVSAMSNDGARLALAARTNEVVVVDLARGEVVLRASTGAFEARSVAWSRDDAWLSTLSSEGEVVVCDSRSGEPLARFAAEPGMSDSWYSRRRHAFVSGDAHVVVAAGGRAAELWDWRRARLVARMGADVESKPLSFAVSRSGRLIATGDSRGVVNVWDAATGGRRSWDWFVPVATGIPGHLALDFAPDDAYLAIGCGDGVVRILALDGSQTRREFGTPRAPFLPDSVGCVRWSDDGTRLVATLFPVWDKRLFDVALGTQIGEVDRGAGSDAVMGAWFSRDGERVVFGDMREVRDARDLSRLLSYDVYYGASGYQSDGEHAWAFTGGMLRVFRVRDGATVLELASRT